VILFAIAILGFQGCASSTELDEKIDGAISNTKQGFKHLEAGRLDEAYELFLTDAEAGLAPSMYMVFYTERERGNTDNAWKWLNYAALLEDESAVADLGSSAPQTISFGRPLMERMRYCDLLLDTAGVSDDWTALNFKIQNRRTNATTYFSINAAVALGGGEVILSPFDEHQMIRLSGGGAWLFSTIQPNDSNAMELSITCAGFTDVVRVPINDRRMVSVRKSDDAQVSEKSQRDRIELQMTRSPGGTYTVPVLLNGVLQISFIVDSGAAEVFISPDVAQTLVKTGTINENDWLPGSIYTFADGSSAKSRRFMLRSIEIGGREFTNIPCAVANSNSAPMLLGQSFLERLREYSINYDDGILAFQ
jgi:clan AA aspartic protease (TIGR02281 family)